jgi:hypothetical protein
MESLSKTRTCKLMANDTLYVYPNGQVHTEPIESSNEEYIVIRKDEHWAGKLNGPFYGWELTRAILNVCRAWNL